MGKRQGKKKTQAEQTHRKNGYTKEERQQDEEKNLKKKKKKNKPITFEIKSEICSRNTDS